MKKIRILMIGMLVMFITNIATAQDATLSTTGTYKSITTISDGDTIEGTMEVGKFFFLDKSDPYGYKYEASADSISKAGTCLIILKGGITLNKMYPIDTVTWYMSSTDTTVLFNRITDSEIWRYLGVYIKGTDTGTKAKLGVQDIKILPK